MPHFLDISQIDKTELRKIVSLATKLKQQLKSGDTYQPLPGKQLAMIFEKPSTRTRSSFEVGINQLGGNAVVLNTENSQLGRGETIHDTAKVLSRYFDIIMIRCFKHETLTELAQYSSIPVINGLTDFSHPCQVMADIMAFEEHRGNIKGKRIAWIGDGNNMTHSWLMMAAKLGFELRVATPKGYEVDAKILEDALCFAQQSGAVIKIGNDPKKAIKGASVVTTDTWVSMGQEAEKAKRVADFHGFMVDEKMMTLAQEGAMFLHCLPAYRGYEVSEEVFEAHADEIFDEAENRLHAQKAVMVWLDRNRNK